MNADFSYRPRSASLGRRGLLVTTVVIVVLLIIDVLSGGRLRAFVRQGGASVWSAGHGVVSAITSSGYFSSRDALESQITSLTTEVAQYQESSAAYGVLLDQYNAVAQMTHLAQSTPGLTAPIVSSLIASPYGTFMIGAGSSDGVVSGDLILSADGFVIGRVEQTGAHTSLVGQLFAPETLTNAVIDGASVSLLGAGGGNAHVQLPRGVNVTQGDAVVAPEYGGRSVGIVGNVASSSASAYSDVIVTLPVNLNVLRFVYVAQ